VSALSRSCGLQVENVRKLRYLIGVVWRDLRFQRMCLLGVDDVMSSSLIDWSLIFVLGVVKQQDMRHVSVIIYLLKFVTFLFKTQVETEKDGIPTEHNTFIEFDVRAYNSPSRTFLYVRAIRVSFMKFFTLIYLERFQDIPQHLPYSYF